MAPRNASGDNGSMQKSRLSSPLSMLAGVVTWLVVTGIAFFIAVEDGLYPERLPFAGGFALANGAAMLFVMRRPERGSLPAFWLQLFSALAAGWLLPISFLPIYTIIWIAMAPDFYSFRTCFFLLAGVLVSWYLVMVISWGWDSALFSTLLYGTFHLFAMFTARNAAEAEAARSRAEALNRELLATQHLLSEASRQSERTRIARDLHDLLGHHLTALSLNLQIAERLADGKALEKVEASRTLARLLLSDVRDAVSRLRDDRSLDIEGALELLAANLPALDVTVDVEEGLAIDDVEVAESLLRCAQEAITNSLRHAGATKSRIRIWRAASDLCLEASDDGRLQGDLREGNGLTGMRERLASIGGSLDLDTAGDALRLNVRIPVSG